MSVANIRGTKENDKWRKKKFGLLKSSPQLKRKSGDWCAHCSYLGNGKKYKFCDECFELYKKENPNIL